MSTNDRLDDEDEHDTAEDEVMTLLSDINANLERVASSMELPPIQRVEKTITYEFDFGLHWLAIAAVAIALIIKAHGA